MKKPTNMEMVTISISPDRFSDLLSSAETIDDIISFFLLIPQSFATEPITYVRFIFAYVNMYG